MGSNFHTSQSSFQSSVAMHSTILKPDRHSLRSCSISLQAALLMKRAGSYHSYSYLSPASYLKDKGLLDFNLLEFQYD